MQGCTTGMAFMAANMSTMVGRRCVALAYAAYFIASFTSAALLTTSALLSTFLDNRHLWHHTEPCYRMLGIITVIVRVVGKAIGYVSAGGFLLHCFFEFYGVYRSCYCSASGLSGYDAYIIYPLQGPRDEIRLSGGLRWSVGSWLPLLIGLVAATAYSVWCIRESRPSHRVEEGDI